VWSGSFSGVCGNGQRVLHPFRRIAERHEKTEKILLIRPSGVITSSLHAASTPRISSCEPGRWSLVAGLLITLFSTSAVAAPNAADSVNGVIEYQSGTSVTTTAQGGPFGNSVEPGGTYAIMTTGNGAGTPVSITTELFKDDGTGNFVSQGPASTVPLPSPIPQTGSWSNVRYKNLAAGSYKIEIKFTYTADKPLPELPAKNPIVITVNWTGKFK
jgi:hypothetical protein